MHMQVLLLYSLGWMLCISNLPKVLVGKCFEVSVLFHALYGTAQVQLYIHSQVI